MDVTPTLNAGNWDELPHGELEKILPAYLVQRRWFGGKARTIRAVSFPDPVPMRFATSRAFWTLVGVDFTEGPGENYLLPLAFAQKVNVPPQAVVARIQGAQSGVLYDALADAGFGADLLETIGKNQVFQGNRGEIRATALANFPAARGSGPLVPAMGQAEQSNTSIIFGDRLILKVYRRVAEGINPDLEIGRFLTEERGFPHTAPVVGFIEYQPDQGGEPMTLGLLQGFVPNQGDAWHHTLTMLKEFQESVQGKEPEALPAAHLLDQADLNPPTQIGASLEAARLLGRRTAEMHLALAEGRESNLIPESFTPGYQEFMARSFLDLSGRVFEQLRLGLPRLPEAIHPLGQRVLDQADHLPQRLRPLREGVLTGPRCRCHGDYHLGQVLFTGQDYVIIDFEGEPARSLAERRLKQSPWRDVAGMIRSFDYAAHSVALPERWAHMWYTWVSAAFVRAYRETSAQSVLAAASQEEVKLLLDFHLLEKAIYELGYELNHRPDWVRIPLLGILGSGNLS